MSSKYHAARLAFLLALPSVSFAQGTASDSVRARYMQELDVATKAQGDQRQALYRIYLGLAGSHETRHQYAEAETYYQSACNVAKTLFGSQSDDVVKALNLIGEMRLHQGRVAEAEQVFHQALKIVESNPDIPRMATAAVLNNLAAVQHMTGNVSRAIALLRKVVATVENDPAVSEEVFGTALSNLAITLREGGTVPEAMATAKRAVSLLECCKDSDHFAVSLVTLSRLHLDQGDSASAEAVLLRALSTIESASKEDSPTQALIFAHLGVLYGGIGRPRQAEPYFQRAIEIERRLLGPEHPTLLDSMDAYAAFLRATNRRGDAKKLEAYVREQREKYRLQNPAVANVVDVNSLMRRRSH